MIKVMFVCHGNICRSPMAAFVLEDMTRGQAFEIASSATSREEIGRPVHPGTQKKLAEIGIACDGKRAVQFAPSDYAYYDYILCMDDENVRNLLKLTGGDPDGKIQRLLAYTEVPRDIADPWYTGDFETTYRDVVEGCKAFLEAVTA